MTCCASTTRQGRARSRRILDFPSHRIQIVDDTNESFDGLKEAGRSAAEMVVLSVEPRSHVGGVPAEKRMEASIETKEENRQLALFARGVDAAAAGDSRGRRRADPEDPRQVLLRKIDDRAGANDGA
jgi:hypothetical protein